MKPRKPIKRSPLKRSRTPIRKLGKKGKARNLAMRKLHAKYNLSRCQQFEMLTLDQCPLDGLDFHHKILRSQGGKDVAENIVALCRYHHSQAHGDFKKLQAIRNSGANLSNGETIQ